MRRQSCLQLKLCVSIVISMIKLAISATLVHVHIGSVDMKDFLLTLIAFKLDEGPTEKLAKDQLLSVIDDQCSLYFHLFDIDDTGFIDVQELKLMVQILFKDQRSGAQNSEELFKVIDLDSNGRICYEEFKKFYASVIS